MKKRRHKHRWVRIKDNVSWCTSQDCGAVRKWNHEKSKYKYYYPTRKRPQVKWSDIQQVF